MAPGSRTTLPGRLSGLPHLQAFPLFLPPPQPVTVQIVVSNSGIVESDIPDGREQP
jgi:hypothetical protein